MGTNTNRKRQNFVCIQRVIVEVNIDKLIRLHSKLTVSNLFRIRNRPTLVNLV
jgi:hypothetical protein